MKRDISWLQKYKYIPDSELFFYSLWREKTKNTEEFAEYLRQKAPPKYGGLGKELYDYIDELKEYWISKGKEIENRRFSSIDDVILHYLPQLPIRLYLAETRNSQLEYYILTNPSKCKEICFLTAKIDDQTKLSKLLQSEMTVRSAELSRTFEAWSNTVEREIEALGLEKPPKGGQIFLHVINILNKRHLSEPLFIDKIHQTSFDTHEYCLKYIDLKSYCPGPTPTWDEFMNRLDIGSSTLSDRSASSRFKAWVWGILEPGNKGRAGMWIQGAEGMDGKSTVATVLCELLGRDVTSAISQSSYSNQFFFATTYRKLLAVFPDCKNRRFISDAKAHNVLGQDIVNVEFKGKTPFASRITAKVLICSNVMPELTKVHHELSRILFLKVAPPPEEVLIHGSSTYESKLLSEGNAFLHECRKEFLKHCKTNANIELSQQLKELRLECISDTSYVIEKFIREKFVFKNGLSLSVIKAKAEISKFLRGLRRDHPTVKLVFVEDEILTKIYQKTKRKETKDGAYWLGICLKAAEGSQEAEMLERL